MHALPLSERTYACTACGAVLPRDKNSARVMLFGRAELTPAAWTTRQPLGQARPSYMGCQCASRRVASSRS